MRPVRLDLNGFASFRDPAVVDFTDADYFALVGPTGSGKSTVIDAVTFALYGTAYRWGRSNAVADALAPTANRCTVRLVFDIGNARYSVTREVRRTTQQVQQKSAILERFADPNATGDPAGPAVDSEVIAGDPREVRAAVENLLGLSFEDFCQCVVLPQGEFATFLKATAKERQTILLKLLGAAHYEGIGRLAGQRAAAADQTIKVLTEQLAGHADATQAAEDAARDRQEALAALLTVVDTQLPAIAATTARLAQAKEDRDRLATEHEQLAGVATPAGVIELHSSVTAAEQAYRQASQAEETATTAAALAADAVRTGPNRQRLEQAITHHTELAALQGRQEAIQQTVHDTTREVEAAKARVKDHAAALATARTERDRAHTEQATAQTDLANVTARRTQLAEVTTPGTVANLAAHAQAARTQHEQATTSAETAEQLVAAAIKVVESLPPHATLTQAGNDLTGYETAERELAGHAQARAAAEEAVTAARAARQAAEEAVTAAKAGYEQLRAAATAAELRPHLAVGHACPVCEQAVATLPPPAPAPELDAARSRLQQAETAAEQAHRAEARAERALADADARVQIASRELAHLDQSLLQWLPERPAGAGTRDVAADRAVLAAKLSEVDAATKRRGELEQALKRARAAQKAALDAHGAADRAIAAARNHLHAVRGRVAVYGAPELDDADLAAAWAQLSSWAAGEVAALDSAAIPAARHSCEAATAALTQADQTLAAAETRHQAAVHAHTQAAVTAEQAGGTQRALQDRIQELEGLLVEAPPQPEAADLLVECARLERVSAAASEAAAAAAKARRAAEQERDQWRRSADQARSVLSAARDQLVPLGAPAVDGPDVAAGWAALAAWAQAQAQQRAIALTRAEQEASTSERQLAEQLATLGSELAAQDIPADHSPERRAPEPTQMREAVVVELERARAATAAIVTSREQRAALQAKVKAATETQQVAAQLASLMRSTNFPQWLANAALDTLVAGASSSLRRLSGDQYDLIHKKGDFYVIDHSDADSRRSVRTLSGGETFQASLALALALSEQLASLAAGGTAKLESIFLDEGFGTLDPDSLETVADTLENLAQGERMVGVITHVAALAERAPVRYQVHRDSRSSTVTREGT